MTEFSHSLMDLKDESIISGKGSDRGKEGLMRCETTNKNKFIAFLPSRVL